MALVRIHLEEVGTVREPPGIEIDVDALEFEEAREKLIVALEGRLEALRVALLKPSLAQETSVVEALDEQLRDGGVAIDVERGVWRRRCDDEAPPQ